VTSAARRAILFGTALAVLWGKRLACRTTGSSLSCFPSTRPIRLGVTPYRLAGRSLRASSPPLTRLRLRFAILAPLVCVRRLHGRGDPEPPPSCRLHGGELSEGLPVPRRRALEASAARMAKRSGQAASDGHDGHRERPATEYGEPEAGGPPRKTSAGADVLRVHGNGLSNGEAFGLAGLGSAGRGASGSGFCSAASGCRAGRSSPGSGGLSTSSASSSASSSGV